LIYLRSILFGRFVIEDFDLAAFGHLEVVGGLDLAHGVALAQVQVYFDPVTHDRPPYLARLR
jgi:hypothetical protein